MLAEAHTHDPLSFFGDHAALADKPAFKRFLAPLRSRDWVVYPKGPFAGPQTVLDYLGGSYLAGIQPTDPALSRAETDRGFRDVTTGSRRPGPSIALSTCDLSSGRATRTTRTLVAATD
jgi:hypothetical protein